MQRLSALSIREETVFGILWRDSLDAEAAETLNYHPWTFFNFRKIVWLASTISSDAVLAASRMSFRQDVFLVVFFFLLLHQCSLFYGCYDRARG